MEYLLQEMDINKMQAGDYWEMIFSKSLFFKFGN